MNILLILKFYNEITKIPTLLKKVHSTKKYKVSKYEKIKKNDDKPEKST